MTACSKDEIAYTTYMEMSMVTMDTVANENRLHCQCPGNHIFVRNETKFLDTEDGMSIIATAYKCSFPPRCGPSDTCMAITESAHSSFVTRKCSCPIGSYCPNDIRVAAERIDLDQGAYFLMKCK
ncbi:hypothetical protein HDE_02406 [Halotydeus destructor]|nr:hypothetical protein HDE_02406 [Halotydeus destructor]